MHFFVIHTETPVVFGSHNKKSDSQVAPLVLTAKKDLVSVPPCARLQVQCRRLNLVNCYVSSADLNQVLYGEQIPMSTKASEEKVIISYR